MPHLHAALESYCVHKIWISCLVPILDSLVVRIPACHAGGRGQFPVRENIFERMLKLLSNLKLKMRRPGIEPGSQECNCY